MKNILVITDFSPVADNAAAYAVKLAVDLKANLILFHAIAAPLSILLPTPCDQEADNSDKSGTVDYLSKLKLAAKKLRVISAKEKAFIPVVSYFTEPGNIKECIHRVVLENEIDLIVMGARLNEEFPGYLFGTNVRGVVDEAGCPVLLVHEHAIYRLVKNMFYITDLRYCDLKITGLLTAFAHQLDADVSLLHVCTDGLPPLLNTEASEIFQDTIASNINYKRLTYQNTYDQDIQSVLSKLIEKHGIDLLTIANKKYHFLNHLFRKNIDRDPTVYTQIPILIVPQIKRYKPSNTESIYRHEPI